MHLAYPVIQEIPVESITAFINKLHLLEQMLANKVVLFKSCFSKKDIFKCISP